MRRIALALVAMLVVATAAAGCGKQGSRLSIATGNTTGVYYIYGGGLAKLISANLKNVEATASVTSGSVENIKLLVNGGADLAFSQADAAADAVGGKGAFTGPQPIRALAHLYDNYAQLVATTKSGVRRVADLRGKRVSVGGPNSGTQLLALRMLEAAGLKPDTDVKKQQLGINESVQAMKDGTIDAFVWVGGLPTAGITDLTSVKKDVRLVDTADVLKSMRAKYGDVYTETTVPVGTYGLPGAVKTVGVASYLLVNAKMDNELAYGITKLLFDKKQDLVRVHPEAKKLDLAMARQVAPTTLHPGAERYFREHP